MLAKVFSCAVVGLDGVLVEVEVDVGQGIPGMVVVGLPDAAVRESQDRVRAAIRNSGGKFPLGRVTVNLAPADLKKAGPTYDLPIALGVLVASNQVPPSPHLDDAVLSLGGLIGREGQESELFVIVNLDNIWVDLAVSPEDIASVREGLPISLRAVGSDGEASARIIFVSPLLDRETRNARVIASMPNPDHRWKPGTFVTAEVPLGDEPSKVIVPRKALQTVKGNPTLFVRDGDGFEARQVRTGREDDDDVEIVGGLEPGETYAVANTFTLKAELEKSAAGHGH